VQSTLNKEKIVRDTNTHKAYKRIFRRPSVDNYYMNEHPMPATSHQDERGRVVTEHFSSRISSSPKKNRKNLFFLKPLRKMPGDVRMKIAHSTLDPGSSGASRSMSKRRRTRMTATQNSAKKDQKKHKKGMDMLLFNRNTS
jgi:hypothetical protein